MRPFQQNEMFKGVTKKGKKRGGGGCHEISHPPIEKADLDKIYKYFEEGMTGTSDERELQEMLLFYVVVEGKA